MRANSKVLRIWNSRNGERSCWKTRIGAPHWCVSPEMPRATLPPPSAAYKEEHERNFLRSVFRQYKKGYPLDRLFPSRVYRSLQERGVIHHSRAEKLYALSLFKNYRPTSRLYMPEEARQAIINSKAMAWLLKREFDAMTELRFDDEGARMAA